MSNKGNISNENIIIKAQKEEKIKVKDFENELHIDANELIKDDKTSAELFNNHYINIVEKTSGVAPNCIGNPENPNLDRSAVLDIINKYKDHPSITKIKYLGINKTSFEFTEATTEGFNKIIRKLDPYKATGLDRIPIKVIKACANIINSHLTYIINKDRKINKYSEGTKTALVRPTYKKDDRDQIKHYRPVSLLNGFPKIFERFLHDSLSKFTDQNFSKFIPAYGKSCSSSHVLMRLTEDWKASLDNKKLVETVFIELSKAFDSIPHNLLIAKVHAYGLTTETLIFLYSYLQRRRQEVKINDAGNIFKILLLGVPQRSILGPILFNIFINDLFLFINKAKLANFADDNTIYANCAEMETLIDI